MEISLNKYIYYNNKYNTITQKSIISQLFKNNNFSKPIHCNCLFSNNIFLTLSNKDILNQSCNSQYLVIKYLLVQLFHILIVILLVTSIISVLKFHIPQDLFLYPHLAVLIMQAHFHFLSRSRLLFELGWLICVRFGNVCLLIYYAVSAPFIK